MDECSSALFLVMCLERGPVLHYPTLGMKFYDIRRHISYFIFLS
jgi:hypothetical protein